MNDSSSFLKLTTRFWLSLITISLLPLYVVAAFIWSEFSPDVPYDPSLLLRTLLFIGIVSGSILVAIYYLAHYFIGGVGSLLAWLKKAREKKFVVIGPLPFSSTDELGQLGHEMSEALMYFKGLENREQELAEEKAEFVSVLAHQLWTPITGLTWGLSQLSDQNAPPALRTEVSGEVHNYLERMTALIKQLLEVAQIEGGTLDYHFKQMPVAPLLQKSIEEFTLAAKNAGLTFTLEADPTLDAYIDADRLLFAISNLVSNAVSYTKPGGHVTVSLIDRGNAVEVRVADTGIGMKKEDQERLFTKFNRNAEAMRMRPEGFGVGLFIARNIVRKHGSDIKVESEFGKGSTFSFTVPKSKPDALNPQVTIEKFFTGI